MRSITTNNRSTRWSTWSPLRIDVVSLLRPSCWEVAPLVLPISVKVTKALNKKFEKLTTGWHTHPVHTGKIMRTGWHPHQVVIWKKIDNRMTCSSGWHFFPKWQPDGLLFGYQFFWNENRMGVPSSSHFEIKLTTRWNPSGSHTPNRRITPFAVDNAPKSKLTTIICNITY